MHFELFDVDVATATIHDARVGDEGVYTGATVQWRGYGRGDRAWMVERLTSALASWTPDHDPNGRWRLTATLEGGRATRWSGAPPTVSGASSGRWAR